MISSKSTDLYRTSEIPSNNFATSKRTTGYERLTENRTSKVRLPQIKPFKTNYQEFI